MSQLPTRYVPRNRAPRRPVRVVDTKDIHANPAPPGEWPLVVNGDGHVLMVCPRCSDRIRVFNLGQAWALAKGHNEFDELDEPF